MLFNGVEKSARALAGVAWTFYLNIEKYIGN